jgi:crotonobetainyl-CoA:carnitine CoA-transferase CaiB-like acyl-CoA transferase
MAEVARRLAAKPASHWEGVFAAADCCVNVVLTLDEAMRDLHLLARGVFGREVAIAGHVLEALPVPLAHAYRGPLKRADTPALGEANIEMRIP